MTAYTLRTQVWSLQTTESKVLRGIRSKFETNLKPECIIVVPTFFSLIPI